MGRFGCAAAHIPEYSHGTWTNHSARRTRKLLLTRREIAKIERELDHLGNHTGSSVALLFKRVREGGDRVGHGQAGIRQARQPLLPVNRGGRPNAPSRPAIGGNDSGTPESETMN